MGAIEDEQVFVDGAYATLGKHVSYLNQRIAALRSAPSVGTVQDELERQAQFENLARQLKAAQAASTRLCFGRIDTSDRESFHIGRIGLRDHDGDPVLLDWRAPNAAGFYQATTVSPMGIVRRRRIIAKDRTITHVEDEDLADPTASSSDSDAAAQAVEAPREGRMGDIIATIAADQDAIVRSPLNQITVVEGGPGTGKTVVALHRAAWLLYTFRDRLAKDGVLVIGPSTAFLHYIEQVLPSLGETDVVLLTPGQLYPGISATRHDAPSVAAIKGDVRMAAVVAAAAMGRRRIPDHDVTITLDDGSKVAITARQLADARKGVPRGASFHAGRDPFLTKALDSLARDRCRRRQEDPSDEAHRQDALADIVEDRHVKRTLNLMWLPISPQRLVHLLLTDPATLEDAAEGILTKSEQKLLLGARSADWTVDDVPLLDEAAHVLGDYTPPRSHEHDDAAPDYAELSVSDPYSSGAPMTTVAERALDDREWIYGHVVVDEAQELSTMAWHCIARRSSRRSMTIVGDLQQTTHPAGAKDWDEALSDVSGAIHLHTLTVTYRITKQTAATAIDLLTDAGGHAPNLQPIRDGAPTERFDSAEADLATRVESFVGHGDGRACVILPDDSYARLARALTSASTEFGTGDTALDAPIAVLTARDTKGLEFDTVIVVDPKTIAGQAARGSDVYVACTRATKRLALVTLR
ncbi:MAG: AAA family ATPase [Actinobacteria bacterium]|uniref:Unannotated protein n=1 Tax=freshwater metagenome TaxID=449393 RepID=A0A6J7EBU8_9ZZZZ|nr:AAA family ATPase [Actinomycetota bacterium]